MDFVLTGGDWPVFFKSTLEQLSWLPQVWSPTNGNGFGQNTAFVLGYKTFFTIQAKFYTGILNLPWFIAEKLIFFVPYWLLSFTASYFLGKYFLKDKIFPAVSSIIFATNTYSLMLVGGGQMGVAIAYALSTLVILFFLKLLDRPSVRMSVHVSLLFGLLLCIDPRIAAIVALIVGLFFLSQFSIKKLFPTLGTFFLAILINAFWILPFLFSGTGSLSEAYTKTDILYFLSFARLENALGLLHPNWPENIFGKVGFMRVEFLVLAFFAFSAFLFKPDKKVKVLGLIALLGVFLSKGVNDPFGSIYYFLSNNVPLFTIFRDSTKWYLMVVISYSILIPITLYNFIKFLKNAKKIPRTKFQIPNKLRNFKYTKLVIIFIFIIFWGVTIRQLFFGELSGTFRPKKIPVEFLKLEAKLSNDNEFYRILWVPQQSRFGYYSSKHPAVNSYDLITSHDLKPTIKYLEGETAQELIREKGIKYIIVPSDPVGELFLIDRKYNSKLREQFIKNIGELEYVRKVSSYEDLAVYEVKDYKGTVDESNKTIPEQRWVDIGVVISVLTLSACFVVLMKKR